MEKVIEENKQGTSLVLDQQANNTKKLFIESYGCQMNFSDSEIVASILANEGYNTTQNLEEADLVLVNTCSIRDKAEQTVRKRLEKYNAVKSINPSMKVGVLGCMAERLKSKFLEEEKIVDMVVGPDAYKDIPNLLKEVDEGRDAINVILSKEETYGDIAPVRLNSNGVTAFVSITRGCDNMCTFCVVPFTRGRERSREPKSIMEEIKDLHERGFKEITLLGQNVDSYLWYGGGLKKDFEKATEMQKATAVDFAQLLDMCATTYPKMHFRFSTSNPQDMHEEVIHIMAKHHNICKYIHLPLQSGSTRVLQMMNRTYTAEWYRGKIDRIREILPGCAISSDIICGFCSETEEEHLETIEMMEYARYDMSYMFYYSERPGTLAARRYADDIPEEVKKRRLTEVVETQNRLSRLANAADEGKTFEVLIEGNSKRDDQKWMGRNSQNKVVIFPKNERPLSPGQYVQVTINHSTQATLFGNLV